MGSDFYITNRQKLLFMVQELHKRGFGKLRVIPFLSPSGVHWRCIFKDEEKNRECTASNWIAGYENEGPKEEIKLTINELAELFMKDNQEFIAYCKGANKEYEDWYQEMLKQLEKDDLPYAFADWETADGFWETSKGKMIKTLSDEREYYF